VTAAPTAAARVPAELPCQGGPVPDRVLLAPVRGAVGSSADRRAQ